MKIKVKVKPNSKENNIDKINDNEYKVSLKEPAKDNMANISLIKLLSKYLNKKVKIKSGFSSKNKIIEVEE